MKIALITGGSRGLGANMAYWLSKKDVAVIVTYNNNQAHAQELIEKVNPAGKIFALKLDISNTSGFQTFTSELQALLAKNFPGQGIDYLVNNAGHGLHKAITETSEAEIDLLFNVHFKAPYLLTAKLLPLLNTGGKILNVSTGLARFATPGYSAYASMKGAVEVMTRYMAKEFAEKKITVNSIAPGAIETDFGGGRVRDNKELNSMVSSWTALGRAGLPDDIGQSVADLLTSDANWMTAQRIEISGGMFI